MTETYKPRPRFTTQTWGTPFAPIHSSSSNSGAVLFSPRCHGKNFQFPISGPPATGTAATGCYFYDANGHRVRDTAIPDCNGKSGLGGGMGYTYDLSGRYVMNVATGGGGPCSYELYVGSRHLLRVQGAYDYSHADWLGTERVRTSAPYGSNTYSICESTASLPFGDGQTTTGTCYSSSPLHFTGKERDSETGLDNFGARYNSSSFGRFMSPDWSAKATAVPYAEFGNPQSLNLYSYVLNNPISRTDPDGHYTCAATPQQCKAFKKALAIVRQADLNLKEGSKERKQLDTVVKFYGEDDGKGPTIKFADLHGTADGKTVTIHGKTTITFDPRQAKARLSLTREHTESMTTNRA